MLQQRTHVERITEDPQIMTGKPVVTGTRIPVEQVLAHLAETPDLKALFVAFPRLTTEDVQACFAFASQKIASEQEQVVAGRSDETVRKVEARSPAQHTEEEPDDEFEIEPDTDRIHFMSIEEGRELFDKQARKYLSMSGEDFRRQYRAGLLDREQSEVIRVSFLLPFAEYPDDGHEKHS